MEEVELSVDRGEISEVVKKSIEAQKTDDLEQLKASNLVLMNILMKYDGILKENVKLKRQVDDRQDIVDRILEQHEKETSGLMKTITQLKEEIKNMKEQKTFVTE